MVGSQDSAAELVYLVETTLPLLEAEILKTRTYLKQLEQSHHEFSGFINRKRRLLSPVLRLPSEVLRLVFWYYANETEEQEADDTEYEPPEPSDNDDEDEESGTELDSSGEGEEEEEDEVAGLAEEAAIGRAPEGYVSTPWETKWRRPARSPQWTLLQVCRRWRTIASGYAQLWTSLSVNLDLDLFHRHNTSYALLKQQVAMAGVVLPLRVEFFSYSDTDEARNCLRLVASLSDQWEMADLCIPPSLLPFLATSFPNLRQLSLSICNTSSVHTLSMDSPIELPALRKFHSFMNVPAILQTMPQNWFKLPWSQLTSIATSVSVATLPTIMSQLDNVTDCDLIVSDLNVNPESLDPPTKITVPHLNRLSLLVRNETTTLTILESLTCPALRRFSLSYADYAIRPKRCETTKHLHHLHHFFSRSQCPVTTVHLPSSLSINTANQLGVPFLESISSVEEATLSINSSLEPIITLSLLPNVRLMSLSSHSLDMPKVLRFVEARKGVLKRCYIALWEFEVPPMTVIRDTLLRMKSLSTLGLEMRFTVNGQIIPLL